MAGVFLGLIALWLAWIAIWLRRVELRDIAAPAAEALGLSFAREGLAGSVRACGVVAGRAVELQWTMWGGGVRVRARIEGSRVWEAVPVNAIDGWVRGRTG